MGYVALLRGINVGGHNKLVMADLKAIGSSLGLTDVSTYLNTGNLLFTNKPAKTLAQDLTKAIAGHNGLDVPVVVVPASRIAKALKNNPFGEDEPKQTLIYFCDPKPTKAAIAKLDLDRSPGDSLEVVGGEIFLRFSEGAQKTKFTLGYLEKTLGVVATSRNLNTAHKLLNLAGAKS